MCRIHPNTIGQDNPDSFRWCVLVFRQLGNNKIAVAILCQKADPAGIGSLVKYSL